ncbi:MAG: hypothetical protein VCA73_03730 [Roseibacillus sp.]|jgi:glucose/arabinose dehydrogenase
MNALTEFKIMRYLTPFLFAPVLASAAPTMADFYQREEIPLPPGEVMEGSSIAIIDKNKVALGTRRGDVWICDGAFGDVSKVKWTRFTSGLHEPLGMAYRDGWFHFTQRPDVSKMRDTDGDGRADEFRTIAAPWGIKGDYHEYAFGTDPDRDGNIWVVLCLTGSFHAHSPWRGWCFRITPDGRSIPTCSGIRSPGGIGFNMEGDVFYCDNQGVWNGSSSLKHLKPGGFVGNPSGNIFYDQAKNMGKRPPDPKSGSRIEIERKRIPELVPPAVWLPHGKLGQSPTGVIPDHTKGAFGPFAGQVLVGEQTHSQVHRVFLEKINGVYQGVAFPFLDGFRSGIVPLRLADDGSLFVGTTNRGWGARGGLPFSFERTRWTGKVPFEIHEMRIKKDGFELTFTGEIDPKTAGDKASYSMNSWTYIYQSSYGSPEVDKTTQEIVSVTVGADRKSVLLKVKNLQAGHTHHLQSSGVRSKSGGELWHKDAYYTINEFPAR